MRTTGRSVQISNDLFNTQMIEPRILRVQPDPGLTIERLTGMHVSAGEIVMEIPTQIIPPAVIDRGHQATQQLNSNHTLRLLALIDTYRGPTRIQTSLVVPDQSDKPVPDQIDILNLHSFLAEFQRERSLTTSHHRTPQIGGTNVSTIRESPGRSRDDARSSRSARSGRSSCGYFREGSSLSSVDSRPWR